MYGFLGLSRRQSESGVRNASVRAGATAAVVVASLVLLPGALRAGRISAPAMRPCQPSGQVRLSTKLTCPHRPVDVVLSVDPGCPSGEYALAGAYTVRIANPLPDSIVPYYTDPGPGQATGTVPQWTFDSAPVEGITVSHQIAAETAGRYSIGDAGHVEVEDASGNIATGRLVPDTLVVVPVCSRPAASTLYLPVLHRPSCVPARLPADIVLLMDRSGSMAVKGLETAAEDVGLLFSHLDLSRDRVGLVLFDQAAEVAAPLGSDAAVIQSALATTLLAPGTRLDRAIEVGLAEVTGVRSRRDARQLLVLVTDGVQTGNATDRTARAAARLAEQHGVTILGLAVGSSSRRDLLEKLTGSPGHVVAAPTSSDAPSAYRRLADLIVCAGASN
jgi:Mg-chelatase subunit ChlD